VPPGSACACNVGNQFALLRKVESADKKGYALKILLSTLALKAGSCVNAGEKVLDSIARPAMAIRGSDLSVLFEVQEAATISKQKAKTEMFFMIERAKKILKNSASSSYDFNLWNQPTSSKRLLSLQIITSLKYSTTIFPHWLTNSIILLK
jgi:cysteinyl-tRNA synthetase